MVDLNLALKVIADTPDNVCSCALCKKMCARRACWGTPADMTAIIEAGYGGSLCIDYWCGGFDDDNVDVLILAPAENGQVLQFAPDMPGGKCVFHTKAGLCRLHKAGLKPTEGSKASHSVIAKYDAVKLHEAIARTWDTEEGRLLVKQWRAKHGV